MTRLASRSSRACHRLATCENLLHCRREKVVLPLTLPLFLFRIHGYLTRLEMVEEAVERHDENKKSFKAAAVDITHSLLYT